MQFLLGVLLIVGCLGLCCNQCRYGDYDVEGKTPSQAVTPSFETMDERSVPSTPLASAHGAEGMHPSGMVPGQFDSGSDFGQ